MIYNQSPEIGDIVIYNKKYLEDDIYTEIIIDEKLNFGRIYKIRKVLINFENILGNNWYKLDEEGDYNNYYFPCMIFTVLKKESLKYRYDLK